MPVLLPAFCYDGLAAGALAIGAPAVGAPIISAPARSGMDVQLW